MRSGLISLALLIGCGADPIQQSTKKSTTSKNSVSIEQLRIDLDTEIEQNKKEIAIIRAELLALEKENYSEFMDRSNLEQEVLMNKHMSSWPPEIQDVRSIVENWVEEDKKIISDMTSDAEAECDKYFDEYSDEYKAVNEKQPVALKNKKVACDNFFAKHREATKVVDELKQKKRLSLSKEFLELLNMYGQKQKEMYEEADNTYIAARKIFDSQKKENQIELERQIKDIRAIQKQRENDLIDKIIAIESKSR